jgi:hypothetical protein
MLRNKFLKRNEEDAADSAHEPEICVTTPEHIERDVPTIPEP